MLRKINLSAVVTFLVGLAVFSSWVSQSLLDLSTGLVGVLAVLSLFSAESRGELFENRNLNRVFPWMAGYFVVACLGYYFNGRPGADVVFCLTRFSWILLLYVLVWGFHYFDENRVSLKLFYFLLVLPALYGFNIFFNDGNDLLEKKATGGRIIGLVQSATYHSHIGGFIAVCAVSWLYLSYFHDKKDSLKSYLLSGKIFYWVVAVLVFLSAAFSQTRGALLAIVISLAALLWIKHGAGFVKWLLLPGAAVAVLILTFTPVKDLLIRKESDGCRVILAKVHVEMVKSYPLLGIGYRDNMRQIADFWPDHLRVPYCEWAREEGSQAHNQFLNVAATTGLLGLLTYAAIVIWFFILNINWYRKEKSDLALVCLVAQIYFQASCMTEITFEFAKIRVLILLVWALVAVRAPEKLKN